MSFRDFGRVHLVCAVVALAGCRQAEDHGPSRVPRQGAGPESIRSEQTPPLVCPADPSRLLVPEIMARIHAIPPWPSGERDCAYGPIHWSRLVQTARDLQKADPIRLETACQYYVVHYETSFEGGIDIVAEWSKPLLLLRMMFDIPETEELAEYHPIGCMGFGGFGWQPICEGLDPPRTLALPLTFKGGSPAFTALRFGYNGPAYRADEEYRFFVRHFRFRNLEALAPPASGPGPP